MPLLIAVMTFASCFMLAWAVLSGMQGDRRHIARRLMNMGKTSGAAGSEEFGQPLFSRALRPMLDKIGRTMMKITPGEYVSSLEKKIERAGNPGNLDVKGWLNIQAALVAGMPLLTLAIARSSGISTGMLVLMGTAEAALGFVLPGFILGKMIGARQKAILDSLPDFIDLLAVSVEAGLGFDAALMKVAGKKPGPLACEFEKSLQEIKIGRSKKEALKDMAERLDIRDMHAFVGAVVQAEQFGVGIANVLRIQAAQARMKKKQRVQEMAMKVPVKMMIPMVVFIFPVMFIVLLGPVVIRLVEQLSRM